MELLALCFVAEVAPILLTEHDFRPVQNGGDAVAVALGQRRTPLLHGCPWPSEPRPTNRLRARPIHSTPPRSRRICPDDLEIEPRHVAGHPSGEIVRRESLLHGVANEQRGSGIGPPAPLVGDRGVQRIGPVAGDLEGERQAPFEREVGEHALAEAVDGHDVGAIEVQQGQIQAPLDVGAVDAKTLPPFKQALGLLVRTGGLVLRPAQRGPQRRAQAIAQFAGRRDGERDHQQFPDLDAFLDQQPGGEGGQRIGLAGARAGLDQQLRRIAQPDGQRGLFSWVHLPGRPSASSSGNSSVSARSAN